MTTEMTTRPTTVEVERFDVNASDQVRAGRPLVLQFRLMRDGRRRGTFDVRVGRERGELHIFATGPSGGDRGHVQVGLKRAAEVVAFANAQADDRPIIGSTQGYLMIRRPYRDRQVDVTTADRLVTVSKGQAAGLAMRFGPTALGELRACLGEWAATALAGTVDPPVVGERFVRGPLPGGTVSQRMAWVLAGPAAADHACVVTGAPGDETHGVAEDRVRWHPLGADGRMWPQEFEMPLVEFYGAGWRRLG